MAGDTAWPLSYSELVSSLHHWNREAVFLALAFSSNCRGSDPNNCDGSGSNECLPLSDLKTAQLAAACEYAVRCGEDPDVATCEASLLLWSDHVVAGVNEGKIVYNGVAAAACMEEIRSLSCKLSEQPTSYLLACAKAFRGTLTGDATCDVGEECESAICMPTSSKTGTCGGTCAPNRVPVGGDCSGAAAICADSAACIQSKCAPAVPLGQPCDRLGNVTGSCLYPLICASSSGIAGWICTNRAAEGEACNGPATCDSEMDYCDPVSNTCVAKIAVGSPCPSDLGCVDYAACVGNTCVARRIAGEACDASDPRLPCLGSLVCTNGTCVLPSRMSICP